MYYSSTQARRLALMLEPANGKTRLLYALEVKNPTTSCCCCDTYSDMNYSQWQ